MEVKVLSLDGEEDAGTTAVSEILNKARMIAFDPMKETVEEFLNKFYDVFVVEYDTKNAQNTTSLRKKTYIYNDLTWSVDYTNSNYKNEAGEYIKIYDSLVDYENASLTLTYRTYGKDSSGKNLSSNTNFSTIVLKLKNVKNSTIESVQPRTGIRAKLSSTRSTTPIRTLL